MRIVILLLSISLVLISCKKNKFKRSTFLQELYDYKINPEVEQTISLFNDFSVKWEDYLVQPSLASLNNCKEVFKDVIVAIDRIQFYNLGEVSKTYIYNKFNKGNIDTTEMWNFYSSIPVITPTDIKDLANSRKGIYVIEYLLYSDFSIDSLNSSKYRTWISSSVSDISSSLLTLQTSWGVYEKNFTESVDDGVDGAFNMVCNRIIHTLEDMIDKRLNPVLLSLDETEGVGYLSNSCLTTVKTQVQQLYDVYIGNGVSEFNSIHNYVRKKKRKLAEDVKLDFEGLIAYQNTLTHTMKWYLDNDIQSIEMYKQMLKDLLINFKLDVINAIGVIITFGDTDGD